MLDYVNVRNYVTFKDVSFTSRDPSLAVSERTWDQGPERLVSCVRCKC